MSDQPIFSGRWSARTVAALLALAVASVCMSTCASAQGYSGGSAGASASGNNDWTGSNSFIDSLFSIKDNADPTKIIQFQASGISAGQTRVFTVPDGSSTICVSGIDCGFSAAQTFSATVAINATITQGVDNSLFQAGESGISVRSSQTPDAPILFTGPAANHWIIAEQADIGFDFAHAASVDPSLYIQSHNQSATEFLGLAHNGTNGVVLTGSGNLVEAPASGATWGVQAKTLTETTATAFVQIGIPSGTSTGGTITYSIEADDATDFQARSGILPFAAVNKAGTETCTVGTVGLATEVVAVSSASTLTNTFTCATTPTNGITILANATSSLTQTTLRISYSVKLSGFANNVVTPQ